MMTPQALHTYIWQDIRKEVKADTIELELPFFFGNADDAPLRLVWNRDGVLSDGGRTMAELKKRVGDTTPLMEKIHRILQPRDPVELVAGHQLVVRQFQTVISPEETFVDYRAGVSRLLRAISLISVIDTLSVSEDGEVSL